MCQTGVNAPDSQREETSWGPLQQVGKQRPRCTAGKDQAGTSTPDSHPGLLSSGFLKALDQWWRTYGKHAQNKQTGAVLDAGDAAISKTQTAQTLALEVLHSSEPGIDLPGDTQESRTSKQRGLAEAALCALPQPWATPELSRSCSGHFWSLLQA